MSRTFRMFQSTGLVRLLVGAAVTIGVFAPQPAVAQSSDSWKGTIAPFYLWATRINGDIATRAGTLPVFMTFDDAEHNLAGAFSFHFEAEKSRFGIFSDLDFVRLRRHPPSRFKGRWRKRSPEMPTSTTRSSRPVVPIS